MADFILDSLRAGLVDSTPESALPKDACTIAENVEFFYSALGERRAGCEAISLPAGIAGDANLHHVAWMHRHTPGGSPSLDELWVMTGDVDTTPRLYRLTYLGWTEIAFPSVNDAPAVAVVGGYLIQGQSLHGKLFIAYGSATDRLHVWDGTVLRRAGLAAAAAPSVANTGGGAYAATLRYYRVRYIAKDGGGVVLRRGEPSTSTAFTPSGGGAAARVSKPAALTAEGETHWEIEVSLDNAAFYRLSQTIVGTTTYDDSAATTTYSANPLSDPVGSYATIPAVAWLSSDDDRLLMAGAWATVADSSAVRWTPVGTDPLPGPDERLNNNTSPRVDLDNGVSGYVTGLSKASSSSVFVFKNEAIYKLLRTGQLVGAYEAIPITKTRGAFWHSVVDASDAAGIPVTYFVDPEVGPMRLGSSGLEFIGSNLQTFWGRVNQGAEAPCHGLYYPDKRQVHYWVAVDGSNYPNAKIVLQVDLMSSASDTLARNGWATVPAPARIAKAYCSTMMARDIEAGDTTLVPFIGMGKSVTSNVIQVCDVATTDDGVAYLARVKSRPFFLTNILNRHGIDAGALLGKAGSHVLVKLIRDFGTETLTFTANMTASGAEDFVIAQLDDLTIAELYAVQIQFEDDPDNPSQWRLLQLAMKPHSEQSA